MHTEKTNAMRALDRAGVKYGSLSYLPEGKEISPEDAPSGVEAAAMMGLPPERVFKTLVTQGKSLAHYVFVIPVARELDLKKARAPWVKIRRNDKIQGTVSADGLRARRLLPSRNEKTVRHRPRRKRARTGAHSFQRGQNRQTDRGFSRRPCKGSEIRFCGPYGGTEMTFAPRSFPDTDFT